MLALLCLSREPWVQLQDPPSAADVIAAHQLYNRVKVARKTPLRTTASWDDLQSAALLGGRAVGLKHISLVRAGENSATVIAGLPLPAGFWINCQVWARPDADGYPRISGRIGYIPIPAFLIHAGIDAGRAFFRLRGVNIPPFREMVGAFTVNEHGLAADLTLPARTEVVSAVGQLQQGDLDGARIADHYCRLMQLQKEAPSDDMAEHVRRGFRGSDGSRLDNRSVFVAISMFVAGFDIGVLLPQHEDVVDACGKPDRRFQLLGRKDLALHWTMSAAITSVLGSNVSIALGTWKEISDSGPGGSGFSLVDLAADRSGTFCAQKGADSNSVAVRNWLADADATELLPIHALALAEGMREDEFRARYTSTENDDFDATVANIDASLEVLLRF